VGESEFLAGDRTRMRVHALNRIGRANFQKVLDIGCGDGLVLRSLAKTVGARAAVGIDLNAPNDDSGAVALRC
jgi:ubiquinone/menaquinone biosynthesis C-methylase UbiE